jgi:hypothetical protein
VARELALELPAGGPTVHLLEADGAEPDEATLRESARRVVAAGTAAHSARSYRYPFALVAWHEHAVGVDIERVEPLDDAFLESIVGRDERLHLAALTEPVDISSLWCSKEALAKALGDALSYDPRVLDSPLLWPEGRAGVWRASRLDAPEGHVAWVCWRSS